MRKTHTAFVLGFAALAACSTTKQSDKRARGQAPRVAEEAHEKALTAGEVRAAMLQLHRVHFAFDSARLTPASRMALTNAAALLAEHSDVHIRIDGHADQRGSDAYNIALGRRRAEAVASFLASRGVLRSRLDVASYGKSQPVASGHDRVSHARNRRAEFQLVRGGVELQLEDGQLVDDRGRPLAAERAVGGRRSAASLARR